MDFGACLEVVGRNPKSEIEGLVSRVTAIFGLGIIVFAVTLGVYIGTHLSNEAMAVLMGAACGVGAIAPALLIAVLSLLRRRERDEMNSVRNLPQSSMYPPVIVVSPPAIQSSQPNQPYITAPPAAVPRQFTVIGDDTLDAHT